MGAAYLVALSLKGNEEYDPAWGGGDETHGSENAVADKNKGLRLSGLSR